MFIKLVNPLNGGVHVFQIGQEIRSELKEGLTEKQLDGSQDILGQPVTLDGRVLPTDNRRFMAWPEGRTEKTRYRALVLEVPFDDWDKNEQLVVFTNWNAYLMSDTGQTIDRLFTYRED